MPEVSCGNLLGNVTCYKTGTFIVRTSHLTNQEALWMLNIWLSSPNVLQKARQQHWIAEQIRQASVDAQHSCQYSAYFRKQLISGKPKKINYVTESFSLPGYCAEYRSRLRASWRTDRYAVSQRRWPPNHLRPATSQKAEDLAHTATQNRKLANR